jgi:N-acetyl-anhydromuramyl-L-alanine amidase AmpD
LALQIDAIAQELEELPPALDPHPTEPTLTTWPERLEDYEWMPAYHADSGDLFVNPPDLIVIHSGARGAGVAEYLSSCGDGREVSAHFSWSSTRGGFVQQVSLKREAWHAGGSLFFGQGGINMRSIGIELPGPWDWNPRPDDQKDKLRALLAALKSSLASLKIITAHSFIATNRRDPGPGVNASWFDGLGFEKVIWRNCRRR